MIPVFRVLCPDDTVVQDTDDIERAFAWADHADAVHEACTERHRVIEAMILR